MVSSPADRPRQPGVSILVDPPTPSSPAERLDDHRCGWLAGGPLRVGLAATVIGMALSVGPGCVRVYHPMSGLHDPAVVDPSQPNFTDTLLTVRCVPGKLLNVQQSAQLCRKVALLFENQGAQVLTYVTEGTSSEEREDDEADVVSEAAEDGRGPASNRLELVLRSRETHRASHLLTWAGFGVSFGILPGVDERSFAQDLEVRDADGFLLVADTLQGRMVRYVGASTWVGNKLLDWTVRDDEEDMTGGASERHLTDDLYLQLSQHVFNAKMRSEVLRLDPGPAVAAPAAPVEALSPQALPGLGILGAGTGDEPQIHLLGAGGAE